MKARSFHRLRMPLRITTCVALAVLSACTSPPVHFHTLAMTDSAGSDAVASPPAWLIDIQAVHVTAPADGNRFVVQSGRGRVDILEQERWAAPLGDELRDGLSTRVASGSARSIFTTSPMLPTHPSTGSRSTSSVSSRGLRRTCCSMRRGV